jgi:ERCC4-type nuclease
MILLDSRDGSYPLARIEPLRTLLPTCPTCQGRASGVHLSQYCAPCRSTGRQLSHITTSRGEGGPDVLMIGNGPSGPITVAVEVKSIRDLLQAADTGRLQAEGEGQLPLMLADYDQSWLLWYGTIRCGDSGHLEEPGGSGPNGRCLWRPFTKNGSQGGKPLPCEFLDALLIAVAAMGVHVHHVGSEKQAARWLASLYRYWTKPYDEHKFTHTFNAAPRFPKAIPGVTSEQLERARRVFDRYPGLGMERALAAARHFGSVKEMANADEVEWRKVPGIGKVIAAAVVKGFNS